MTTLTAMRGYSSAGKSTRARLIADDAGAVVVNRDLLRLQLVGKWWTGDPTDEERVTLAEEAQVNALLRAGVSVVSDNTHLNPKYLRKWARLATRLGVEFSVEDVHADPAECKRRDHARMLAGGRYVGDTVIERQTKQWPVHKWPTITAEPFIVEPVEWIDGLPEAIICDIDSTLAHIPVGGRSPYDYSRVIEDELDETIVSVLEDYAYAHPRDEILIVSGRDHTCRAETLRWLNKHSVPWDQLLMRDADLKDSRGGKVADFIAKYKIFNDHIRGKFNIRFCLDDRRQVIDMWRALNLKVLDVAGNEF